MCVCRLKPEYASFSHNHKTVTSTNNIIECGHCLLFPFEWVPFDHRSKAASSHGLPNAIRTSMPIELGMGMGEALDRKSHGILLSLLEFSSSSSINASLMVACFCLISGAWKCLLHFCPALQMIWGEGFHLSSHLAIAGNPLPISLGILSTTLLIHACVKPLVFYFI